MGDPMVETSHPAVLLALFIVIVPLPLTVHDAANALAEKAVIISTLISAIAIQPKPCGAKLATIPLYLVV
ncbi:MAG TPA: hypothetical protein VN150_06740 [Ochrobactrum sp.]|nr:hypothetical protein [Ochrobactrum sp.]